VLARTGRGIVGLECILLFGWNILMSLEVKNLPKRTATLGGHHRARSSFPIAAERKEMGFGRKDTDG